MKHSPAHFKPNKKPFLWIVAGALGAVLMFFVRTLASLFVEVTRTTGPSDWDED